MRYAASEMVKLFTTISQIVFFVIFFEGFFVGRLEHGPDTESSILAGLWQDEVGHVPAQVEIIVVPFVRMIEPSSRHTFEHKRGSHVCGQEVERTEVVHGTGGSVSQQA